MPLHPKISGELIVMSSPSHFQYVPEEKCFGQEGNPSPSLFVVPYYHVKLSLLLISTNCLIRFLRRLCSFSGISFRRRFIYNFCLGNGILMPLEGVSIFSFTSYARFILTGNRTMKNHNNNNNNNNNNNRLYYLEFRSCELRV